MNHTPSAAAAALVAVSIPFATAGDPEPSFQTHDVVPEKELLITNPAVVDSHLASYPGPLSFGHLVEQLAAEGKAGEFVLDWLESWESTKTVNGQKVAARPDITKLLIDPWMEKDGFKGRPRDEWEVDLANAPFRLLAVVNRMDTGPFVQFGRREVEFGSSAGTSSLAAYYGSQPLNTGEGRFVFAAIGADGEPLEGGFTVIFEYSLPIPAGLPEEDPTVDPDAPTFFGFVPPDLDKFSPAQRTIASRLQAARYAARWHELGSYEKFDDAYLCALAELAIEITARADKETPPLLAQLRTNEGALAEVQEAREYGYASNKLTMRPVASTPAIAFNDGDGSKFGKALSRYINSNQKAILAHTHTVPLKIADPSWRGDTLPFRAGSALMPKTGDRAAAGFRWDSVEARYSEALRNFSLNTCNGCHCGETGTEFYHIAPRRAGEESKLSKFLRMDDSEHNVESLGYHKRKVPLKEMRDRGVIFRALLNPYMDEREIGAMARERKKRAH